MESKNMNYMFNVEYFDGPNLLVDNQQFFEKRNTEICDFAFSEEYASDTVVKSIPDQMEFELTTLYPGLLNGLGNPHNVKSKGAIKNGFCFDYVTGLPNIEGSYLKGVLRSPFPDYECLSGQKKWDELEKEKLSNITEVLEGCGEIGNTASDSDKKARVKELMELLFEKTELSYMGAFPILGNGPTKLLKTDFITKHEKMKNPNPIEILKVREGIVYRFYFRIPDNPRYRRNNIIKFFKQIILIWGLGAKTNVGYGLFDEALGPVTNVQDSSININVKKETEFGLCIKCKKNKTKKKPDSEEYYPYCPACHYKIKIEKNKA
ncbi:MAG: type III-B CRISPR module RAMP protein Cmr6 [Lachnospiraceae bacterium]|nr:type III-B CRISPR module RAMP protein Cmr6 [Lachnospiraceae bacterium]